MYLLELHEQQMLRRYAPLAPSLEDYGARLAQIDQALRTGDASEVDRFLETRARLLGSADA